MKTNITEDAKYEETLYVLSVLLRNVAHYASEDDTEGLAAIIQAIEMPMDYTKDILTTIHNACQYVSKMNLVITVVEKNEVRRNAIAPRADYGIFGRDNGNDGNDAAGG